MITQYFLSSALFTCFYFIFPGFISAKRPSQRYCSSLLKRILRRNQIKMLFISHLRRVGIGFPKDALAHKHRYKTEINAGEQQQIRCNTNARNRKTSVCCDEDANTSRFTRMSHMWLHRPKCHTM